MPGRLADPVRHQGEDDAADERSRPRQLQRTEPPARETAGEHERDQDDQVVRPHVAEDGPERPVRHTEEPTLQVRRGLRLGAERVRVREGRRSARELVADEPEGPAELEMVAGGCLAVTDRRSREVVRTVDVTDRGPCGPRCAQRVDREGDEHET